MVRRKTLPPPVDPSEMLVVARVRCGTARRWLLGSKPHGERLFKPSESLATALEGFYVMSGFTPRKVLHLRGSHTHEKALQLIAEALR